MSQGARGGLGWELGWPEGPCFCRTSKSELLMMVSRRVGISAKGTWSAPGVETNAGVGRRGKQGEVVLDGMVEDGSAFLPGFLTTDSGMDPCSR